MRSSSSWLGHKPSKLAIPGSNPGDRTNFRVQNHRGLGPIWVLVPARALSFCVALSSARKFYLSMKKHSDLWHVRMVK